MFRLVLSQKAKGAPTSNLQHIAFMWRHRYYQVLTSAYCFFKIILKLEKKLTGELEIYLP